MKARSAVVAALLLVAFAAGASDDPAPSADQGGAAAMPAGGRVALVVDRSEFFLGENITLCYRLENTGSEPLRHEKGGYYPTLRRNDAYAITAVLVDEHGKPAGKPLETVPVPENFGGIGPVGGWKLEPGEVYQQTLYLPRYLRLDTPGRYRIRVVNHERGEPKHELSAGETTLTLRAPAPPEAREIFRQTKKMPRGPAAEIGERRDEPIADFEALIHPVYLPILADAARQGDRDALDALGNMQTADANQAVVDVIRQAAGKGDLDFAVAAYHHMVGLPDPRYEKEKAYYARQLALVARAWRSQFAEPLRQLAGRLARDPKPVALEEIARIYEYMGTADDLSDLASAYTKSIEATKTLPFETHQYFRPRGSAYIYRFAALALLQRGAKAPTEPKTPGEVAVYMIAMKTQKDFRPRDWPERVAGWLGHEIPYLREMVLEYMPEPVPEAVLDRLPDLLADPYVDLQIAACHMAKAYPREAFREPLRKILERGSEQYLLNAAAAAAPANGITNDRLMEIWLARIGNDDLGGKAVVRLLLTILEDNQARSQDRLDPDVHAALKTRWSRFINDNREKLRQGHRLKLGDPEIAPDLFPKGFQFYFDGKPWPEGNE